MFVLDTDVLSVWARPRRSLRVLLWMESVGVEALETTVINIAEVQCGIEAQRVGHPALAAENGQWLDSLLSVSGPKIHPLCADAARLLARMHQTPALRHFTLPDPAQKSSKTGADLAIASIAIVAGAVIATGNERHFRQIHACFPLAGIYNPFVPG